MAHERRRTAVTVVLLSLITIASKLMGLVREQIIASGFGVSAVTDAYVSAQLLPTLLETIMGAAMAAVLLPLFTAARARGKRDLARLVVTALICLGSFYALEALVLWAEAPLFIRLMVPGLGPTAMAKGVALARIFAPTVGFLGMSSLLAALLNVHEHFLVTGIAALAANLAVMVAAVVFRGRITVELVAWAVFAGLAAQLAMLTVDLRRARLKMAGVRLDWRAIREVVVLALPLVLANGIGLITPVTDKYLASRMSAGSIAALSYALKLVQLPVGVLVLGLSTVLFARFSQMAVDGQRDALATQLGRTLQGLVFTMLPTTALIIILANPVVAVVFQRGQFDQHAVAATSGALVFYAIGLLPMSALPVLTNMLFALRNTRAQLAAGLLAGIVYVAAAVALGPLMAHRGLALAFSLGQIAQAGVVGLALLVRLGARPYQMVARSLPATVVATVAALVTGWGVSQAVHGAIVQFVLGSLAGGSSYLAVHLLLHTEEAGWVLGGLRLAGRRLAKRRPGA